LDNNLTDITVAYERGGNKYTEEFYSKPGWPEAELITPLVNDGVLFHAFRNLMLNWFDYLIDHTYPISQAVHYRHDYSCILVYSLTSTVPIRTKTAATYSITRFCARNPKL